MCKLFFSLLLTISLILFSLECFSSTSQSSENSLTFQIVQTQITFNSSNIKSVAVVKQDDNKYGLTIQLKAEAADEFARLTNANIGKIANIVFNGKIISTAMIQSKLGGSFLVTGFSKKEVETLASSIK